MWGMSYVKGWRDIQVQSTHCRNGKLRMRGKEEQSWSVTTTWETSGESGQVKLVGGSVISRKHTGHIEKLHEQKERPAKA